MDKAASAKKAKQKRNRVITACFECRERKAGCDRKKPICIKCKDGRTCIYLEPPNHALVNGVSWPVSSLPPEIKDKVTRLYRQCLGDARDDDENEYEGLEANPLVTDAASYDDDAEESEVTDLGFYVGKVHLTDRVGGQYRPGMAHELKRLLMAGEHQREWHEEQKKWPTHPGTFDVESTSVAASFLHPSPSYLAPSLNLLSLRTDENLATYMPPMDISSKLLHVYWTSVHPVARVLHRPSFERRWHTFLNDINTHTESVKSLQALVFSVLFSGIAAMPQGTLGENQQIWMDKLKAGTEIALVQAQMLQTAKVETLQAFVAYLIILCRAEVSRVHSSLVAAAVRLAECNGLHCDGEQRGYNPIETHVRRLIWFNLCFLDIRTTEAQGPRPLIRMEDYTTKFPANINDTDLTLVRHPVSIVNQWTEMTLPLIRFRCNEFIRKIWGWRRQVIAKEMSITPVINNIESFRLEWSLAFTPSDPDKPLQRYGLCMLDLQTLRTYAMVLHPYHMHPKLQMPDRLLSILIENGIKTMDKAIELETEKDYAPWRWYAGALQQHHYALLMATEIILNPRRKESSRIWRGLDYVFEPPSHLPPIARARWILTQACWKMEVYTGKRQLRAPMNLELNLREALRISREGSSQDQSSSSPSTENAAFEDGSACPTKLLSQQHKRGSQSSKKRTPVPKGHHGNSAISPKADASLQSGQAYVHPGNIDVPFTQPSPTIDAPAKQMIHVEWDMLNEYYPPDQYTGSLDMPFDTWANVLQMKPWPAGNDHQNINTASSNSYALNYNSEANVFPPRPIPGPGQTIVSGQPVAHNPWGEFWSQSDAQPNTQASVLQTPYKSTYSPPHAPQQQRSASSWDTGQSAPPTTTAPDSLQWNPAYDSLPNPQSAQHSFKQQYGIQQQPLQSHVQPQWTDMETSQANNGLQPGVHHPSQRQSPQHEHRQAHEQNYNMGLFQSIVRPNQHLR